MDAGAQLAALADPTRRTIYELVGEGNGSVRELTELLPVSQPAVSQHLRVLREAELVTMTRHGTRSHYARKREGMERLRAWADSMWNDALDAFSEAAELRAAVAEVEARDIAATESPTSEAS